MSYLTRASDLLRPDYIGDPATIARHLSQQEKIPSSRGMFASPASLGHLIGDFAYLVRQSGESEILADLDAYMPPAGRDPIGLGVNPATGAALVIYYVDPINGDNSNGGLSWGDALQSINAAMAKTDVDAVMCRGGMLYNQTAVGTLHMGSYTQARDVSVIAVGPRATMASARAVTWSANGTYGAPTYDSSSTGGEVVAVLDTRSRDEFGDYIELVNVASEALVDATPGSWFYDSNTVTVHLSDGSVPGPEIFCLRSSVMRVSGAGARKVYLRNFHFIGGSGGAFTVRDSTTDTYVTVEDCRFSHNYNSDGFQVKDCGMTVAINCIASANYNDGFNYHEANAINPHFIEIGCAGFNNGNGGTTKNGSTAHESVVGLRFNCSYGFNSGAGVADVNTSKTFNVSCTSTRNTGSGGDGYRFGETAEIWLHACTAAGNASDSLQADAGNIIHWLALTLDGAPTVPGTIDSDFT